MTSAADQVASASARPLRALVADDDEVARRLLGIRLEKLGYDTTLAGDGAEALALAGEVRPDVALLDWMMPELDGLALTRRLRADPELADLPIILLSARSEPGDIAAGLAAGVDDYLSKPVHQTELSARLDHVLRRASRVADLSRAARHDPLTGLPNRRAWNERVEQELARSHRSGAPLCLALLDLDGFKRVNDGLGHQAGDELLTAAALQWRPALRESDVLARIGGDEFGVLLPETDLEGAHRALERMRAATPNGRTTSAGVAEAGAGDDAAGLARRADEALYAAKRGGRDRVTASPAALAHADDDDGASRERRLTAVAQP